MLVESRGQGGYRDGWKELRVPRPSAQEFDASAQENPTHVMVSRGCFQTTVEWGRAASSSMVPTTLPWSLLLAISLSLMLYLLRREVLDQIWEGRDQSETGTLQ